MLSVNKLGVIMLSVEAPYTDYIILMLNKIYDRKLLVYIKIGYGVHCKQCAG